MAERYSAVQAARMLVIEQEKKPIDWVEVLRELAARRGR